MTERLRTAGALIAAYAIALQAVLSGFVLAVHVGFDPAAVVCTAAGASDDGAPLQQRERRATCLAACTAAPPASLPPGARPAPAGAGHLVAAAFLPVDIFAPSPRHRPQASRAPPARA